MGAGFIFSVEVPSLDVLRNIASCSESKKWSETEHSKLADVNGKGSGKCLVALRPCVFPAGFPHGFVWPSYPQGNM